MNLNRRCSRILLLPYIFSFLSCASIPPDSRLADLLSSSDPRDYTCVHLGRALTFALKNHYAIHNVSPELYSKISDQFLTTVDPYRVILLQEDEGKIREAISKVQWNWQDCSALAPVKDLIQNRYDEAEKFVASYDGSGTVVPAIIEGRATDPDGRNWRLTYLLAMLRKNPQLSDKSNSDIFTEYKQFLCPKSDERMNGIYFSSFLGGMDHLSGEDIDPFVLPVKPEEKKEDYKLVKKIIDAREVSFSVIVPDLVGGQADQNTSLIGHAIDDKAEAIVLDLRGPMIFSSEGVIDAISLFISDRPLYGIKYGDDVITHFSSKKNPSIYSGPLLVWTNDKTVGGAEMVASALQYYKRGMIVGEKTGGFTHMKIHQRIGSHNSFSLSMVSGVYSPNGKATISGGISPDVSFGDSNSPRPAYGALVTDTIPPFEAPSSESPQLKDWEQLKMNARARVTRDAALDAETKIGDVIRELGQPR